MFRAYTSINSYSSGIYTNGFYHLAFVWVIYTCMHNSVFQIHGYSYIIYLDLNHNRTTHIHLTQDDHIYLKALKINISSVAAYVTLFKKHKYFCYDT